jgi:GT2 family glycosyltransferase
VSGLPRFSVVIPTYDRPSRLAVCLKSMTRLDYPRDRFEVIVVDDGSAEPLGAAVRPVASEIDVTLLRQTHGGPAAARNTGSAQAKGDLLAYTGDDCTPAEDWLRALARRFEAMSKRAAVGGRTLNALEHNPYSTASHLLIEYLYSYYNAEPDRARFLTPNNLSVPRDLFGDVGGFDPSFVEGTGEDRDFCDRWLRRGHGIVYDPQVLVSHAHALTFRGFCRQQFAYGRGSRRYRETRARRDSGRVEIEPFSFYVNLLRYPLARLARSRRVRLTALMAVSQLANTAGYLWQGAGRRAGGMRAGCREPQGHTL